MDVSLQVWVPEREGGGRENWVAEGTGSGMMQEEETELQNVCEVESEENLYSGQKMQTAFKGRK